MKKRVRVEWVPALLAGVAFIGVISAFAFELLSYRRQVAEWARRELTSRAGLAAANLLEPLRTQDFPRVRQLGEELLKDGYRLTVLASNGRGRVFDARGAGNEPTPLSYAATSPCGDYQVRLSVPQAQVLRPFHRAQRSFLLAALLGVTGVLLFFIVIWRQRVRLAEMARVERFRREFIADVSHEIKTPLTGILGAVDLLEDKSTLELQLKTPTLISMIGKEAKRLNGLVQSILDLARLEREGEVIRPVETDLTSLVSDVAARYGVSFSGATPSPCPPLRLDPQLIEQAISNLIENAKRHSGSSEISVSLAQSDAEARITVEDHGIGIPPEHAAQIFERFHRVDPARASETGGAGLGLAIVRRIARLHGGDVVYNPAVPRGCAFALTLPAVSPVV